MENEIEKGKIKMSSLASHFPSLGFIGTGHIAGALLRGTVGRGLLPKENVWACDVVKEKLDKVVGVLGIQPAEDARAMLDHVQYVLLAVTPQVALTVLDSIRDKVRPHHCLISVVAGKTTETLGAHLPEETRIVRVMPNTPALVGLGAAGVAAGDYATAEDLAAALELLRAVGIAYEVPEAALDAVTALSGSGPAYVYRFMEIMAAAGEMMGLEPDVAHALTLQTVQGAVQMARESGLPLPQLRRDVTSPGGTTAAAMSVYDEKNFDEIMMAGILRARTRAIELAQGPDAKKK